MPETWQASVPTLVDKQRGEGFGALRPIGLVSVLQRTVARCRLKAIGPDMLPKELDAHAYRKRGSIDIALMPVRLSIERCRELGTGALSARCKSTEPVLYRCSMGTEPVEAEYTTALDQYRPCMLVNSAIGCCDSALLRHASG